jgi:hypothetical protein
MNEPAAVPPPAAQPLKLPVWAIVLIVVVILCCCCFGALGLALAFWDPLQQELGLSALLPWVALL